MNKKCSVYLRYIKSLLSRNLQLLGVCYVFSEFFCLFNLSYVLILIWLLYTPYFYVAVIYLIWIIYDWNAYKTGGHLKLWFRRLSVWKYTAEYFSLKLHKTVDLDPNGNYIIGYHPHGITGATSFLHFSSEATGFSRMFPGITSRLLSLDLHYMFPIHREMFALSGICGSHKESLEWIISRNGKGNAAVIVVGGAREALDAVPNTMHLSLKNKKGFIKLALKHGTSLVPCISFGENEMYSQIKFPEDSIIRKLQMRLLKLFGFSNPIFYGRGIFGFTIGYLPYRKRINTIVGRPIRVKKIENPTQDDIDCLHKFYVKSLCNLFYNFREKFSENPNLEITIK